MDVGTGKGAELHVEVWGEGCSEEEEECKTYDPWIQKNGSLFGAYFLHKVRLLFCTHN